MSDFELEWRGREVLARLAKQRGEALFSAAGFLREQANRTVPIEEGTLQRSGGVEVDADAGEAAVFYDTPYAVIQHEATDFSHSAGRRAKWLELSAQEQLTTIRSLLADGIGKAFR